MVLPNATSKVITYPKYLCSNYQATDNISLSIPTSDEKACTFVGTAAYIPPEVLNSSPATFG